MKSSEEMTEYVIKKLNEQRQKVSRRNAFIRKITLGLVNPEKQNALTEEFTDSEEMKGVRFMNRKFSLIATTVSLLMIMTATVSIISLNMGKPDFDAATDMIESSTSETSIEYSTGTSASSGEAQVVTAVSSDSVYVLTAKATDVSVTYTEETYKTAKTTYLVKSTQTTAVRTTDTAKNTVVTAEKTEIPKTEEPVQTTAISETSTESIQTEEVTKVQITTTVVTAVQTEEPVQTTINPVADENIEAFQLTPSTDGVDEFMESFREKYGHDGNGNCYNVTPKEITDKYDMRIFKFDYDGGGHLYGDGFLLYENEIYPIGISFGGWGLTSFAIADTDHNGSNELYFTFSFGSGIHRSMLGYFDMQSKDIIYFDYEYWDYDMILSNKNGMLSICHAEEDFTSVAGIEFTAGEEIGRIGFVDNEIQLALIEN